MIQIKPVLQSNNRPGVYAYEPISAKIGISELHDVLRTNDVEIKLGASSGTGKTKEQWHEDLLIRALFIAECSKDAKLLARVVRGGGFSEYCKKLEKNTGRTSK